MSILHSVKASFFSKVPSTQNDQVYYLLKSKVNYKSTSDIYLSIIKNLRSEKRVTIHSVFSQIKNQGFKQNQSFSKKMDSFISNNITLKQYIPYQLNYTFIYNNNEIEPIKQNNSCNQDVLTDLYNLVMQYKRVGYKKIRQIGEIESEQQLQKQEQEKDNYKQCSFKPIHEELPIEKSLESSKIFALAGGFIIYLQDYEGKLSINSINQVLEFRLSKKFKDGSLLLVQSWNEVIQDYRSIENILLSTQNQYDYLIANSLQQIYSGLTSIKEQICYVLNTYDQTQLEILIEARRNYMQQYVQNIKQSNLSQDDFFMIMPFYLNFEKQTLLLQDFQISSAFISLIGSSSDLFINYVMRKNLIQMCPQQTRLKFYLNSLNDFNPSRVQKQQVVEITNFEMFTIERIMMNTTSTVTIIQVEYPPYLQFKGEGLEQLNCSEYVSILNTQISHVELLKVITTRQAYINSMANKNSDYFWCNLDDFIVDNFEHYMENLIFLEKFYKEDIQ